MLKEPMLTEISKVTHIIFLCLGTEHLGCAIQFAHPSTVNIFMNTSCDGHELSLHFISISLVYPHTTHLACLNTILCYFRQINKTHNQTKQPIRKRNQQFVATPGLNIYLSKYNFYVTNKTSGMNLKSLLQGEGTFLKRLRVLLIVGRF